MRFALAISLCLAFGCSGTRAREVHASAALPKTADPTRCQSLYARAVGDCRAAKDDTPYDDCVNAAVVKLNSCLDAL